MSVERIHQELRRWVQRRSWPEAIASGWQAILAAARPGAVEALAKMAYEAHEDVEVARQRAAVCGWLFALANLIDDHQDGELDYVELRQAPALQALGWSVWGAELGALGLGAERERALWARAERACVGQLLEVDTTQWGAARLREVTTRIAGEQWAIYTEILWADTPWQVQAEEVGLALGSLCSVVIDRQSGDARWRDLDASERAEVEGWCDALEARAQTWEALPGVRHTLRWLYGARKL